MSILLDSFFIELLINMQNISGNLEM